jgi:hypothetical protein
VILPRRTSWQYSEACPAFFTGEAGCFCCPAESPRSYAPTVTIPCCTNSFPTNLTMTISSSDGTCPNFGGPFTVPLTWTASGVNEAVCGATPAWTNDAWMGTFTTHDGNVWTVGMFCRLIGTYQFRVLLKCSGSGIWCVAPYQYCTLNSTNPCNLPLFLRFGWHTASCDATCGTVTTFYCGGSAGYNMDVTI